MTTHIDKVKYVKYHCPACLKELLRPSGKKWIKSFCETAGRYVRIQKVKK